MVEVERAGPSTRGSRSHDHQTITAVTPQLFPTVPAAGQPKSNAGGTTATTTAAHAQYTGR
ncbi:hypothetical protein SKPI104516_03020 [Skermania piniformis]